MTEPQIMVEALQKTYKVHEREAGAGASIAGLFRRKYKEVKAVERVSFSIAPGEVVGFLGPNGAGKTTTLKMLAGLLHPTSGDAKVLGSTPWKRDRQFLRNVSLVMGNRNQLMWDIPAMDSFLVNQAIYDIPEQQFRATLDELIALLDLTPLLKKPVRGLSLGERMKCELAASLLHRPQVLFLDEPTLGVDVTMQGRIRQFVAEHNQKYGATVLLTSHYMADVTALCKRIIVIHHGELLYDGALAALADKMAPFKRITLEMESAEAAEQAEQYGDVIERSEAKVTLHLPREQTASVVARLLADLPVRDMTVEDPPIDEVIELVFKEAKIENIGGNATQPPDPAS